VKNGTAAVDLQSTIPKSGRLLLPQIANRQHLQEKSAARPYSTGVSSYQ